MKSKNRAIKNELIDQQGGLKRTFIALNYPNYRLWFFGQVVSLFGTWMQSTAQGYLIYELTHSPVYLGYVAFAAGISTWLFTLLGGVASDRVARRRLLLVTQTCMMGLAFILACLTFWGVVQAWHIIFLAFFLGVANAFDAPARLALAPELVARQDLTNAIALNTAMFNIATIIGPATAGLIYAAMGPGWCFLINGLSFLAVILALVRMKLPEPQGKGSHSPAHKEVAEGIRYVLHENAVLSLILLVGAASFLGFSFVTLIPAWAVEVLGGDVKTNGLLISSRGFGALIGALSIAALGRINYRGRLLTISTFIAPVLLFVFSFTRHLPISLLILCGVGGALIIIVNLINSLIQTYVSDEIRGRVMSIYSLTFFGAMSIGSLVMGSIAGIFNVPITLMASSLIFLLIAFLFWCFTPQIRGME